MGGVTQVGSLVETRSRIVDVAARLLQEHGSSAVTTRAVAHGAGVQPPMIYRLFGDKDGLLDAVAEHVMATYVSAKTSIVDQARTDGVDPLEDLRAGWEMQIAFGVANPSLFTLLSDPARKSDSPALRAGVDVLRARVHRIASTGRLRVSERRAVDVIRAAGSGTVLTLLSTPVDERDPGLAAAMFETVLREILDDAPTRPESGPLAAAVAFRAVAPRLDVLSDAEHILLREWLDRVIDGH